MKRKSLNVKLLSMIFSMIIATMVITGLVACLQLNATVKQGTGNALSSTCSEMGQAIEDRLQATEQAAQTLADYVMGAVTSTDQLEDPERYRELRDELGEMADVTIQNTPELLFCTIIFDPELTADGEAYFIGQRRSLFSLSFFPLERSDIDEEWVRNDWHEVIQSQLPYWQLPHVVPGSELVVMSYLVPIFVANELAGFVAIDIDYRDFEDRLDHMQLFQSGYAVLADPNGKVIHHPTLPQGTDLYTVNHEVTSRVIEGRPDQQGVVGPVETTSEGKRVLVVGTILANGFVVMLVTPETEIYHDVVLLIARILLSVTLVASIFLILTLLVATRLLKPLGALQKAAARIADGEFDVHLKAKGNGEIAELTRSIQQMADRLQGYVTYLEAQTYQDVLTGAGAKRAYEREVAYRENMVRQGQPFSVVFFDLNGLKKINDTYGHEAGDRYLRSAADLIRSIFPQSYLFRIGGDEFALFPVDGEWENRYTLLGKLDSAMAKSAADPDPLNRISISYGIADFQKDTDKSYAMVFERAEAAMYAMKKRLGVSR